MSQSTNLAMIALILSALSILPGTLGVVAITRKLAATVAGAKFIYGQAKWTALASVILMIAAIGSAMQNDTYSISFAAIVVAFAGVLVFGFLMHVGLNFKPVRTPIFVSCKDAIERFGTDEEIVGVIDSAGNPFGFITRLARRPHIVYQPDGDSPFIMSHCILAHSSMAYATEGDFENPDILVVAVIANNMVFYEKNKQCAVIQVQNRARRGDLRLQTLSTVSTKLGNWQKVFPESPIWLREKEWRDTFYLTLLSRADVIDPRSPVMIYSTEHEVDKRLPMKSLVLGVAVGDERCAYPTDLFQDMPVINDDIGNRALLIASAFHGDFIQVFDRNIRSDKTLRFEAIDGNDGFSDTETGSIWNPSGLCIDGELRGSQLNTVPHYNKIFWYVWADFNVNTSIYMQA